MNEIERDKKKDGISVKELFSTYTLNKIILTF